MVGDRESVSGASRDINREAEDGSRVVTKVHLENPLLVLIL